MTCNTDIFCEEENLSQNKGFFHLVSLTICTGFQDINVNITMLILKLQV